jgi:nucleoside-diphosphate-sugar epimerase
MNKECGKMSDIICDIPKGTRVLVTGATGFTGMELTQRLVEQGMDVVAIARHSSDLKPLEHLKVEWVRGDVFDSEVVRQAANKAKYIFHLAAAYREAKSSEEDYHKVHVDSTQLLVDAARENPNFKRFIHISTIGVHGHIEDPDADETYRFSPKDAYQRTKAIAEKWLSETAAETGFPFTTIRPAAIYGPGDRRLFKLFKMAKYKYFPLLGKGKCYYHLIHVHDLINSLILAATKPQALGEVFIVGNDKPIPVAEIVQLAARVLGRKTKAVRLPAWPFFLTADICESICRPLKLEPPIYRRRVAFYTNDRMFNTAKLRNTLGYRPRFSNERGIAHTVKWYLDNQWLTA